MIYINYKKNVRQTVHIFDTTDAVLKLLLHARAHQNFFLGQLFKSAISFLSFQFTETTDRRTDSFVVSEHAAQPAMADIGHTAALSLLFNDFLRSTLGANKKNLITFGSFNTQNFKRFIEGGHSVLKVNNMNFIARAEDILAHFGVPEAGLVAEMHTSLQHIAHTDSRHKFSS